MSHQVTITRTTTTTTTSALIINTGYLKTWSGLLKLAETILGAVCVGLAAYYMTRAHSVLLAHPIFFFLLATFACLFGTFCLLVACISSLATGSVLSKTFYEVVYHGMGFIFLLAASLNLLIQMNDKYRNQYNYEPYLAASIIGLINSVLYLLSTIVAYRSYKVL